MALQKSLFFWRSASVFSLFVLLRDQSTLWQYTAYTAFRYIAKEWIDPVTKQTVKKQTPIAKRKVISEEASKQIRYALESVVAQGTGRNAFVDGYRVGGKTGTAQKVKDGKYLKNNHIVSFIGTALDKSVPPRPLGDNALQGVADLFGCLFRYHFSFGDRRLFFHCLFCHGINRLIP